MSSVGEPKDVFEEPTEEITKAILADLEKEKLTERINDLGLNYNYYIKTGTNESIDERLFYECPIFTTHNTFIKHSGFFSESGLPNLEKYIDELITLTLHFPICIEIDIKGECKAGHFRTTVKDASKNQISIRDLCIKIIKKYYNTDKTGGTTQERHPLIIHLDIPDKECFSPQDFMDIKAAYPANLSTTEESWEFSTKLYKECKNKVIFREKIYQKKAEKAYEAIMQPKASSSAGDAGAKPRRRSSLMTFFTKATTSKTEKKFYYTKIPEFETNGIPYITYGQSMAFNKSSANFFQGETFLKDSPFPLQVGLHSRIYPGLTTCLKNQNKFSEILLDKVIELFSKEKESIKNVPTLIAINYLTSTSEKLLSLKQNFQTFYGNTNPSPLAEKGIYTFTDVSNDVCVEEEGDEDDEITPFAINSNETSYPRLLKDTMVGGASKKKKKNRVKRVRNSINKKKRQNKVSKRLRKRTRKVKN